MHNLAEAFAEAFHLIRRLDSDLIEIVALSLHVSLSAVAIACIVGLPLGAALAVSHFFGRNLALIIINALMGLPPVVVGLFVYLMLSRSGPLGVLELLYTPTAMIAAQTLLVIPIVTALSRQVIEELWLEYEEQLRAMGMGRFSAIPTLLYDARFGLLTVLLAGAGRAIAEVGAVIIVGGNINHATRVMTTSIALETSKGNLSLALGLGIILMALALAINAALMGLRGMAGRMAYD